MFGKRVRLIYDKLLPGRKINIWKNTKQTSDILNREIRIFRLYISGKGMWKDGFMLSRLGKTLYMIQGPYWRHKSHVDQLKHGITIENVQTHLPMDILCDIFNFPTPQVIKL